MKILTKTLFVTSFAACWSASLPAQIPTDAFYNPFFYSSGSVGYGTVLRPLTYGPAAGLFNADSGELRIGSVLAIGDGVNAQSVNNVVLELADDGRFDLKSYDENIIPPELECTREEVLNAIPQLTLELTVQQAEELIGCRANYSIRSTSLDAGKTVSARWNGIDGVVNSPGAPGGDTWIPSRDSGSYAPVTWIGSSTNLSGTIPSISLNFLEGEKISYSYSEGSESEVCEQGGWFSLLAELEDGTTYTDLHTQFGCDGTLVNTTVSAQSTETTYNWVWYEPNPFLPSIVARGSSWESARITFIDDVFQFVNYSGYMRNDGDTNCGVSDLTQAYELMREGYNEFVTVNLVPCEPDTVNTTIVNGVTTSRYSWRTSMHASFFESPNRAISVTIVDGIAEAIHFTRY